MGAYPGGPHPGARAGLPGQIYRYGGVESAEAQQSAILGGRRPEQADALKTA
jgi:hypothetical protein